MIIVVILLGIMSFIMFLLFAMQKREEKDIKRQIAELKSADTNQKIHAAFGLVDAGLMNEINTLFDELQKNRIHFKRRNHEIEQMMANISHDIRTPLTSALGYIDMIGNSNMSEEEKKETLAIVEKRLIRLKELIDAFFEFSKTISGETKPEISEMNMVSVLEESISHYYDDYVSRNRRIDLHCSSHKMMICTNRNMMMRIFDNLIINALKHGDGDLLIEVVSGENIEISFTNKIYDEDLDVIHIFDEFYTTDISRTKGNTGLGLAIVKQFAQMLDWSVNAEKKNNVLTINLIYEVASSLYEKPDATQASQFANAKNRNDEPNNSSLSQQVR